MRSFRPTYIRQLGRPHGLSAQRLRVPTPSRTLTVLGRFSNAEPVTPSQTVHIRRPVFSSRRWTLYAIHGAVFYALWTWLMSGDEEDEALAEDEEGDESLFIACQFPQQLPRKFYKGSDPEWVEFLKLNRDQERSEAVRKELAVKVAKILAASSMGQRLGLESGNIDLTRWWIDITYPDQPSPEYVRKGLEITDDAIYWKDDVIPYTHYKHLERMLIPKAVFSAIKDGMSLLYRLQLLKVKQTLSLPLNARDQKVEKLAQMAYTSREKYAEANDQLKQLELEIDRHKTTFNEKKSDMDDATRAQHEEWFREAQDKMHQVRTHAARLEAIIDARVVLMPKDDTPKSSVPAEPQQSARAGVIGNVLGYLPSRVAFEVPMDIVLSKLAMMSSLAMHWSPPDKETAPEGCIIMYGDVEVRGSKGIARVTVQSYYHPKDARFKSIAVAVRSSKELSQAPKAGD